MNLAPVVIRLGAAQLVFMGFAAPGLAQAQDTTQLNGLAPIVRNGVYGIAPLGRIPTPFTATNFWGNLLNKTDGIINGTADFPYILPLVSSSPSSPSMQTQAILDAPYTRPNLFQLADGYGTKLGLAYQSVATWSNSQPYGTSLPGQVNTQQWTAVSDNVTNLIWFAGTKLRDSNLTMRSILGTGVDDRGTNYTADMDALGVATGVMARAYGLPAPETDPKGIPIMGPLRIFAYTPTSGALIFQTDAYGDPNAKGGAVQVNEVNFGTGGFNVRPFEVFSFNRALGSLPSFYAKNYNTDGDCDTTTCLNYNSNWAYFFQPGDNQPPIGFDGQTESSSYASGHAIYGWYGGLIMGMLIPERFQQMNTRGAENAFGRIIGGWHWPTDIVASRTHSYFGIAQMMAGEEESYYGSVNRAIPKGNPDVASPEGDKPSVGPAGSSNSFRNLLQSARADMVQAMTEACGSSVSACAQEDTSRFADKETNRRFYEATLTMGLQRVFSDEDLAGYNFNFNNFNPAASYVAWRRLGNQLSVADVEGQERRYARNAGYLLETRFPYLDLAQRNDVLTTTAIADVGQFLENGSAFGAYSRINLFKASDGYGAFLNNVTVTMDAALGGFNAADTWSNDIAEVGGAWGLTKAGTGLLTLAGNNSFTGPITLDGGGLNITGSVSRSSGIVANAGILGGTGSLPSTTINAAATHAPGNSIGNQTVIGDYALNGGTIAAELRGPQSDRINVTGNVTSFTGTAALIPYGGGTPYPGFAYTIVSAPNSTDFATASSLTLDQSQVTSALLNYGTTLIQDPLGNPQTFAVQWRPNNPAGATTAAMQALSNGGNNSLSVATALDRGFSSLTTAATNTANNTGTEIGNTGFTTGQTSAAGMSSGFLEALNGLVSLSSGSQLVAAVNSLSAQPYAAFKTVGLETMKQQRETVLAQAGHCLANGYVINSKSKTPLCAFALAQNSTSSIRGDSNLASYNSGVFSSGFGLEYYPSQKWSVGVNYGYGTSYATNFSTQSASISAGVNSVNLFSQFKPTELWRIRALLGYSNFNADATRSISFIGTGSSLSATPNGNGFTAAIETDYAISLSKTTSTTQAFIKPLLGFAWGSYNQGNFSESVNPLALTVNSSSANSFVTTAGFELSTSPIPLKRSGTVSLRPTLLLAYQVDALANNTGNKTVNSSFTQAAAVCSSCSSESQNLGTSTLNISAGIDLQLSKSTGFYVNASYLASTNASQFGYGGGVRVRF